MRFVEWLKWANENRVNCFGTRIMPELNLADGTTISVQASSIHCCHPMEDLVDGNWNSVNVIANESCGNLLSKYRSKRICIGFIVYDFVPVDIMDQYCELHGGIKS